MGTTVQATSTLDIAIRREVTIDGGGVAAERPSFGGRANYPAGTADGQVDECWYDRRTVNAGANDDLDLQALTQVDADGNSMRSSISFDEIKKLYIKNVSDADHITVGGAAANAWEGSGSLLEGAGDAIRVPAGGELLVRVASGMAVGASSKVLRISGVTSNQTYEIALVGEAS